MKKNLKDKDFIDWFSENLGYGYGTGEQYTIPALKGFIDACPMDGNYDYQEIEKKIGKESTWFLMNILAGDILNYGSSPRYGWLDDKGKLLKKYLDARTNDELYQLVMVDSDYIHCMSDACNCGEHGYVEGKKCDNPLF